MKKSQKSRFGPWSNDPGFAARYAPVHDMVTELLARTDPEGYAQMLEEFSREWKPQDAPVRIIELVADAAFRLRGCLYLEAEILTQSMQAFAEPDETSDEALGRAYIRDFDGPKLLGKLSRYQAKLSAEFSRCTRILRLGVKSRKYAEARVAAELARSKPCTSVIQ